jgi:hypothetical protein
LLNSFVCVVFWRERESGNTQNLRSFSTVHNLNIAQQRNVEESIEQCEVLYHPTLILKFKWNSKFNLNIDTSSHFQIDWTWTRSECEFNHIITQSNSNMHHQKMQLTPNLNDKSNPIKTSTKLQHLELIRYEISGLNETISNLTSLQTLLLSYNSELNRLPSSITKLTSLLHLSLNNTKIQSNTAISVVC